MNTQIARQSTEFRRSGPLTGWQFALLFFLSMAPQLISTSSDLLLLDIDLKFSLIHWSKSICYPAVIALPFYMNGGGFAKLAFTRAFVSANSPLVLLGFLPVAVSIGLAIVQLQGIDRIWLEYNPFYYPYNHELHNSYSGRLWFFAWGQQILAFISMSWTLILALSLTSSRARILTLVTLHVIAYALNMIASGMVHIEDPKFPETRILHSSNIVFFVIGSLTACATAIGMKVILEQKFRPSLLIVTTYLTSFYVAHAFFEEPTDLYGIAASVLPLAIIWLVLRKANLGSEKWAEYQNELGQFK